MGFGVYLLWRHLFSPLSKQSKHFEAHWPMDGLEAALKRRPPSEPPQVVHQKTSKALHQEHPMIFLPALQQETIYIICIHIIYIYIS